MNQSALDRIAEKLGIDKLKESWTEHLPTRTNALVWTGGV